ncbi:hypothetical protein GGR50DRAFT_181918 [Xylaria sp. CBS 124048]|nr:hypothetical protein GGR50DRAFT_181918 [Xylaria sp. CBS 124048]
MNSIRPSLRTNLRIISDIEHQQRMPLCPDPLDGSASSNETDVSDYSPDSAIAPRSMQAYTGGKYMGQVPYPVRRILIAIVRWLKGPQYPRIWKIHPLFPALQNAPFLLLDRFLPANKHRVCLFFSYMAAWLLTFAIVYWRSQLAAEIPGWGVPLDLGCGATFWDKNNGCGVDGVDCRPFTNETFAFRCPATCAGYALLNSRAVGVQEVNYVPLIVGGPPDPSNELNPVYRSDSWICGAAIHSGLVTNSHGGCGVLSLIGEQQNFVSSDRHGIKSIGFDSYFPQSYTFQGGLECRSRDQRWSLLAISVVFTSILSLFTRSSSAFYFGTFIITFWQVGLASDPPLTGSFGAVFTDLLGKFLPAMFCAWVFYDKMGVRRTLKGLTAQMEKTILWLGGCWVGSLTNYTFDFIPISRLTGHDLNQEPGAKAALSIIIVVLVVIVAGQVWCFQKEGRLIRYLQLYALFVLAILISLALPGLNLRLHHYILTLLLLPGTSMQTWPSLVYQGILVGFFVNGIARWGFDPVLQTSAALQGDAQLGTALPNILSPVINSSMATIAFHWAPPPSTKYNGISVLVNDVERFRGFFEDGDVNDFVWTRHNSTAINEYFRFAYVQGQGVGDYTRAGTWNDELEWIEMAPGASRIKARDAFGEKEEKVTHDVWKQTYFVSQSV